MLLKVALSVSVMQKDPQVRYVTSSLAIVLVNLVSQVIDVIGACQTIMEI